MPILTNTVTIPHSKRIPERSRSEHRQSLGEEEASRSSLRNTLLWTVGYKELPGADFRLLIGDKRQSEGGSEG
jgi:hypothetical protein